MGYGAQVVEAQNLGPSATPADLIKCFEPARAAFIQRRKDVHGNDSTAWIGSMLSPQVMTQAAADWRAPTPWEIRHVAGTGSFTRMSMKRGSELVGVNLQSFKRYASNGPNAFRISYAAWHLLLHRLGIQSCQVEPLSWSG